MSTSCASGCTLGCSGGCEGNCYETCDGGCDNTSTNGNSCGACGSSDCTSSCSNCHTSCGSGCKKGCETGCSGGCSGGCRGGCKACTGECRGKCDKGCSTEALQSLYLKLKLDELIMYEDIKNLRDAVENELTRRDLVKYITNTPLSQGTTANYKIAEDLYNYFSAMGKTLQKEEDKKPMHRNVFEAYIQAVKELYEISIEL